MQHDVDNLHHIGDINCAVLVGICISEDEHLDFLVEDVVDTQRGIGHVHHSVAIGITEKF